MLRKAIVKRLPHRETVHLSTGQTVSAWCGPGARIVHEDDLSGFIPAGALPLAHSQWLIKN